MVGIKTLSLLAVAGSALAAPQRGHWHGGNGYPGSNVVTINDVVYTTVMVTVTAGQEPTATAAPVEPTPATPETPVAAATTPAAYTPEATPDASPSPSPSSAPAPAPASSGSDSSGGYMGIVNQWRTAMGLAELTEDATLQNNAQKTCDDSGGQLNHELNPGSMAQVLAPGGPSDFEKVFVGGWLCEEPDLPGMNGICATMSQGWSYDGQTGHAEILRSTIYTKIGCFCAENVWGCDLA